VRALRASIRARAGLLVGAIYVNYAVTAVLALGLFFLLWGLTALSTAAELALVLLW